MDSALILLMDDYVKTGGKILSTGFTSIKDELGNPTNSICLQSSGIKSGFEYYIQAKSMYLKVTENDKLPLSAKAFSDFDLIMMYSDFMKCTVNENSKTYLKLIPETKFGTPGKSYYNQSEITTYLGVINNFFGKGKSVFIPWLIGSQYYFNGNYAHKVLFSSLLKNILHIDESLITNASPLVEITCMQNKNNQFEWIAMLNHSGQQIQFVQKDGWVECKIPKLVDFEMIVCRYN